MELAPTLRQPAQDIIPFLHARISSVWQKVPIFVLAESMAVYGRDEVIGITQVLEGLIIDQLVTISMKYTMVMKPGYCFTIYCVYRGLKLGLVTHSYLRM